MNVFGLWDKLHTGNPPARNVDSNPGLSCCEALVLTTCCLWRRMSSTFDEIRFSLQCEMFTLFYMYLQSQMPQSCTCAVLQTHICWSHIAQYTNVLSVWNPHHTLNLRPAPKPGIQQKGCILTLKCLVLSCKFDKQPWKMKAATEMATSTCRHPARCSTMPIRVVVFTTGSSVGSGNICIQIAKKNAPTWGFDRSLIWSEILQVNIRFLSADGVTVVNVWYVVTSGHKGLVVW